MKTRSKITSWDIIRLSTQEYYSINQLAKRFNCSTSAVKRILYKYKKAYDAFLIHAPEATVLKPFEDKV
ncbi:MAG: hypothetical protein ACPHUE_07690 [Flavobacteriaceae bacterium]